MFALSPRRPMPPARAVRRDLVAGILDKANKDAEEQRRLQREQEARLLKLNQLLNTEDETPDETVIQRITRDLRSNFDKAKAKELAKTSNRKVPSITSEPLGSQERPAGRRKPRESPSNQDDSHRFFAEHRKRARMGLNPGVAEGLLKAIQESETSVKADLPYPTPESDQWSSRGSSDDERAPDKDDHRDQEDDSDDDRVPEMNLAVLGANKDLSGVLDIAREMQASSRESAKRKADSATIEWDGFWRRDQTGTSASSVGPDILTAPDSTSENSGVFGILRNLAPASLASLSATTFFAFPSQGERENTLFDQAIEGAWSFTPCMSRTETDCNYSCDRDRCIAETNHAWYRGAQVEDDCSRRRRRCAGDGELVHVDLEGLRCAIRPNSGHRDYNNCQDGYVTRRSLRFCLQDAAHVRFATRFEYISYLGAGWSEVATTITPSGGGAKYQRCAEAHN